MSRTKPEAAAIRETWEALLERAENEAQACLDLNEANPAPSAAKSVAIRRYWATSADVVRQYIRLKADGLADQLAFPAEVLGRFANFAEEFSNGHIPDAVKDVAAKGSKLWRLERRDLAYAVLYIEAAKEAKERGEMFDRSPVKTVCMAFGVTRKTVQLWQADRDNLTAGVPHKGWSSDRITKRMEEGGGRRHKMRGLGMDADAWVKRR